MKLRHSFISVIVPVFNGERFLAQAISSIISQKLPRLEIVVVDDGSTDDTARIAGEFGDDLIYLHQKNSGPAAARNTGLQKARGEIIAFLDADDLWPENKLSHQIDLLQRNPAAKVAMGRTQFMRLRDADAQNPEFENFSQPRVYLQLGSAIFRRSAFERVGHFDAELRFGEDIDWFLRAREQGVAVTISKEVTLLHRLHQENMTRGHNHKQLNMLRVLKTSLERRRRAGKKDLQKVAYVEDRETFRE